MILLTGGSGHVGANLLRALLAQKQPVRALVRAGTSRAPFEGLDVELVEGELEDAASLGRALQGCSHVYHCAARVQTVRGREAELYRTNVVGTRNLLQAAKAARVTRVVVTSSLGAVGHRTDRPSTEDDGFNPFEHHLPYEASKAWVEHECLKAALDGLQTVICVSTAVLGPFDFGPSRMGRVIMDFANRALGAYIPGGFEFVGAEDLARGHLLAMEKGKSGQRYIITSGFLTVDELMAMLERISGVPRPLRLPAGLMMGVAHVASAVLNTFAPERPQRFTPDAVRLLSMHRRASSQKAEAELGYRSTPIEGAVQAAYDWFVSHGDVVPTRKLVASSS